MINATVTITNKLPSFTGFGIRQDDNSFSQVYIPSHIMRGADMQVDHTYDVMLTDNFEDLRATTPWRVCQMDVGQKSAPVQEEAAPVQEEVSPLALIDAKITTLLESALYVTTGEIAEAIGEPNTLTRDRLLAMFNRHEIVRADVHGKPNLKRASFCLWAADMDAFIAQEGEE